MYGFCDALVRCLLVSGDCVTFGLLVAQAERKRIQHKYGIKRLDIPAVLLCSGYAQLRKKALGKLMFQRANKW
jgi:hypothetical protein